MTDRLPRGSERSWSFADGPTTSVTRIVPRPIGEVWAKVSDIALPATTSPELERVEWLGEEGEPAAGRRFVGHNRRSEWRWSVTCEVTVCREEEAFGWDALEERNGELGRAQSSWRFDLEPVGNGTRVTQTVRLGPGLSGITWAIRQAPQQEAEIISQRLTEFEIAMAATLRSLG